MEDFKGMGYIPPSQRKTKKTLLKLPPELRNVIYELVLLDASPTFRFSLCTYTAVPTLLQVNRQLRAEALGIYYGKASFEIMVHHRALRHLTPWVNTLDAQTRNQLLNNRALNLRVFVDDQDKDVHAKTASSLGYYAENWDRGWYVSVEDYKRERSPVERLCDIEKRRALKRIETPAERKERKAKNEAEKVAKMLARAVSYEAFLERQAKRKARKEETGKVLGTLIKTAYKGLVKALRC
ncbi:hypothetical protein LTR56_008251 [Elasticomyces elasticus]|nr:hypothetical protein LTR56_008251 [Elasticomyces elasticus]KAK3661814.1 hypothetical protein LTR22_007397 [Elasticomyces elasticus]KAK4924418.1 hypothetical protein LTR49_008509 [Elasticomyces elasticus]KAK5762618.1 hypothetical protein LTS12_007208 [Elasticomyces elasticus]